MKRVEMKLPHKLSKDALRACFDAIAPEMDSAGESVGLVVNCLEMDSYELAARSTFVEWNAANKHRVAKVAVVTEKSLWHVVVSAMALASGQEMKAFMTLEAAYGWLEAKVAA